MTFLVLGNDRKMQSCKERLCRKGHKCSDENCDNIILPLPLIINDGKIKGTDVTFDEIIRGQKPGQKIFYGNLETNPFKYDAVSYYFDEKFLELNSALTAKGIMKILYEKYDDLGSMSYAVLGYGRCGKAVCSLLKDVTENVTAVARKEKSRDEAERNMLRTGDFSTDLSAFDVIINTVPCNILSDEMLNSLSDRNMYVEIASPPYGFDITKKDKYSFGYILANGLPGRFFPEESGWNIADTVLKYCNNE